MNINSLSGSFLRLGLSNRTPKKSVLNLYHQARSGLDTIFKSRQEMEQKSKELIQSGDQEALEQHIQAYRSDLQTAFQKLPNVCPGPILLEFFKAAKEQEQEQTFDVLEEMMHTAPENAFWIMEEIVSSESRYETFRYESLKFEQEIISKKCFMASDFETQLVEFVNRARELPPYHMVAAYLMPREKRVEIEYNIISKRPGEMSPLDLLRRRMIGCETLLKEDADLYQSAEQRFGDALYSLDSLPMKVVLAHFFWELSKGKIQDPKTRLTALEILRRSSETCPDYFQLTPIHLPEA